MKTTTHVGPPGMTDRQPRAVSAGHSGRLTTTQVVTRLGAADVSADATFDLAPAGLVAPW